MSSLKRTVRLVPLKSATLTCARAASVQYILSDIQSTAIPSGERERERGREGVREREGRGRGREGKGKGERGEEDGEGDREGVREREWERE